MIKQPTGLTQQTVSPQELELDRRSKELDKRRGVEETRVKKIYYDNMADLTLSLLTNGIVPGAKAAKLNGETVRGADSTQTQDFGGEQVAVCAQEIMRPEAVRISPEGIHVKNHSYFTVDTSEEYPQPYKDYEHYLAERVDKLQNRGDMQRCPVGVLGEREDVIDGSNLDSDVGERFKSGVFVLAKKPQRINTLLYDSKDHATNHMPETALGFNEIPANEVIAVLLPKHAYAEVKHRLPKKYHKKLEVIPEEISAKQYFNQGDENIMVPKLDEPLQKRIAEDLETTKKDKLMGWLSLKEKSKDTSTYILYGAKCKTKKEIRQSS